MANTHTFEEKFSKSMQANFVDKPTYKAFVSTEERSVLSSGDSVVRPFQSKMRAQDVSRGGSVTIQDVTDTNETLTIATTKSVPFRIDGFDKIQSNYNLTEKYSQLAVEELKSVIDGDILSEVQNALNIVDNSVFGGTAGDPITLDESNVFDVFASASLKLRRNNADITGLDPRMDMKGRGGYGGLAGFGAISPDFHFMLERAESGRETSDGDRVGKNGYVSKRGGFDLFVSNNTFWSADLELATQPTNLDTLTIGDGVQTVTITFVSTIGSTAGNVLIGANVDATRVNLAAAINDPSTTSANQVAFSATRPNAYSNSPRELIEDLVAVDAPATDTMAVTGKGISYLILDGTLTAGTDGWARETQHNMLGKKGCVEMVEQKEIGIEMDSVEDGLLAKKVKPYVLYGKKTFVDGATRMVDVKINTASFS